MTPLPNSKCVDDNKENPHYCMLAEHLLKYVDTPLFISESLYDVYQLQAILQIPCIQSNSWPPDMRNCTGKEDQLVEMAKLANYTRDLLV
jgi:hypothetical protein